MLIASVFNPLLLRHTTDNAPLHINNKPELFAAASRTFQRRELNTLVDVKGTKRPFHVCKGLFIHVHATEKEVVFDSPNRVEVLHEHASHR